MCGGYSIVTGRLALYFLWLPAHLFTTKFEMQGTGWLDWYLPCHAFFLVLCCCFRPVLDRPQPHPPNQGTARINHAPVGSESASRRRICRINACFRGDAASARAGVFDQKIHDGQREAGLAERFEILR